MAVNASESEGVGLGPGAFTAISPRQHVITSHLIGSHDVAMNTA